MRISDLRSDVCSSDLHTPLRGLLNPLLAPQRMAALDEKVRIYARDYIDQFKDRGSCEFMSEFAFKFPIAVFLELMGLPQERSEEHTSELQSLMRISYAVFCLKNKTNSPTQHTTTRYHETTIILIKHTY